MLKSPVGDIFIISGWTNILTVYSSYYDLVSYSIFSVIVTAASKTKILNFKLALEYDPSSLVV